MYQKQCLHLIANFLLSKAIRCSITLSSKIENHLSYDLNIRSDLRQYCAKEGRKTGFVLAYTTLYYILKKHSCLQFPYGLLQPHSSVMQGPILVSTIRLGTICKIDTIDVTGATDAISAKLQDFLEKVKYLS